MTGEQLYIEETLEKIRKKLLLVSKRSWNKLPYTEIQGVHDDWAIKDITRWTNGFWPGLLWMMYAENGETQFRKSAENTEKILDGAFRKESLLNHDVGFLWHITAGLNYRLTGNPEARLQALHAADLLEERFNTAGNYIRAWNSGQGVDPEMKNEGCTIIDTMMNVILLLWASKETGDLHYSEIAKKHADKTMEHHIRQDGSVRHIVEYDPNTGEMIREYGGQGYGLASVWSRGQAWAVFGFALCYRYTREQRYLDTAERAAEYFINSVKKDWLSRCDFRAPEIPVIYDSTAGAIAACGFLELSGYLEGEEKKNYHEAAVNIISAMDRKFCDWDPETDMILTMGTERYHSNEGRHIPIIYGDYFFVEAVLKLAGKEPPCW